MDYILGLNCRFTTLLKMVQSFIVLIHELSRNLVQSFAQHPALTAMGLFERNLGAVPAGPVTAVFLCVLFYFDWNCCEKQSRKETSERKVLLRKHLRIAKKPCKGKKSSECVR